MGRQVNLAPDAYEALRAVQQAGETLSDTVRRLAALHAGRPAIIGSGLHADPEGELALLDEERNLDAF